MSFTFPSLQIADAHTFDGLTVFPIRSSTDSRVEYQLADEALKQETICIEELGISGSVPELQVRNLSKTSVLFIEGQELVGAKQNRVLNTSLLIPAETVSKIPVSCVEKRRWRYNGKKTFSSGANATTELRGKLKKSVSNAIEAKQGHRSDQREVWTEVSKLHRANGVTSSTGSMSAAFEKHKRKTSAYKQKLPYVDGAIGIAIVINQQVVTVDLFDRPDTCRKVWDRLVMSAIFDVTELHDQVVPTDARLQELLELSSHASWRENATVGEGSEYRAEISRHHEASALCLHGIVVHASILKTEIH
ncbi:MAG: hypothetical protein P8L85_11805 [Rubripirellula sp.]|nr:hypothetical protein [Rubripirellula sp.]